MALGVQTIKVALAAQLAAAITRDITVRPYRSRPATMPAITMEVTDITYYETMGPAGLAGLNLDVKLWVCTGDPDSDEIAMYDYLSGGTATTSSIFDAINGGTPVKTLGGTVDSCVCLEVLPPRDDVDDTYTAVFPVSILCRKVGAQA